MKVWLAIFIGGGLGSLARYSLGRLFMLFPIGNLPWATIAANALSCFCLGSFVWLINRFELSSIWFGLLVIGFCGGFSTFSSFSYENLILIQSGKWTFALINMAISLLTCLTILAFLIKPAQ